MKNIFRYVKFMIIPVLALTLSSAVSAQSITKEDFDGALNKGMLKHPYLFFSEKDKPALIDRAKNDPESRDILAKLVSEGNRLLNTPVDEYPPQRDKNPRYTNDNSYNTHIWDYRDHSQKLAFLYQMTGDEKYAKKSFEFADAVCDVQTWVDRAHDFPVIYNRIWPWNVPEEQVSFGFDIRAGDTCEVLAIVYDWLYPALTKTERDRIRGALFEKGIMRVRGNYDYHWWTTSYRCNWCGICFSGLGLASLALLTENPEISDVAVESYNRINLMLDELGIDGGWQEGRGYWAYGLRSCIFFMDTMKRLTGGKYDMFKHPKVKDNPADFGLYGITGRFGDGSGEVVGTTHLINKLTTETGNATAAYYRENMFGEGSDMMDIIWPRPSVKAVEPSVKSKHFRTVDWVVMRSSFKDPTAVTIACKAGWLDDPHHGHLDCGNFVLTYQDQPFIREIGSIPYDQKCFDDERWDYPQASSVGHNVIFVNGEKQISGKMKNKPWVPGIGGKVLDFRTSSARDYVLMDPTKAYPGKELKSWRRHILLDKPAVTVVLDEVSSAPGAEIKARFHPDCPTDVKGKFVMFNGRKGKMALIPVTAGDFGLVPGRHSYLPVQKDARLTYIPFIDTVLKAENSGMTKIATIVVPVADENEALAVATSVKMSNDDNGYSLSFSMGGKSFSYQFSSSDEGLVLK